MMHLTVRHAAIGIRRNLPAGENELFLRDVSMPPLPVDVMMIQTGVTIVPAIQKATSA